VSDYTVTINGFFGMVMEEFTLPEDPSTEEAQDAANEAFTCGQCHAYAMAMQEELGGTLIGIGRNTCGGLGQKSWGHVGLLAEDGKTVYDATGTYPSRAAWKRHYGYSGPTDRTDAEYLLRISTPTDGCENMDDRGNDGKYRYGYYRPNMDAARAYARHRVMGMAVKEAAKQAKRT
jgi:hypothetical protein